ncbi:MAG TPA: hypothetical protein VGD56_16720, partial [Gemmatirosa sp.]
MERDRLGALTPNAEHQDASVARLAASEVTVPDVVDVLHGLLLDDHRGEMPADTHHAVRAALGAYRRRTAAFVWTHEVYPHLVARVLPLGITMAD